MNSSTNLCDARLPGLVLAVCLVLIPAARAEFLFENYLAPGFEGEPESEFSRWGVFYAPNGGGNYPDLFAPNGDALTASAAGFAAPGDASPANPIAFWDTANPTIRQTNGGHFIIGPGTLGNIYSPGMQGIYELSDTTAYDLATVVLQFQTEGNPVDWASIRLVYDVGAGPVEVAPAETIREFRSGTSAFAGLTNRTAVQWNLAGLGVKTYRIEWTGATSSTSFQQALLDTSSTAESVVPEARTWAAAGAAVWSTDSNWQEGTASVANGNVGFANPGSSTVTLDGDRVVGEVRFDSAADVRIQGAARMTVNTGITTDSTANGSYTIESPYELGAFNQMEINAGIVRIDGSMTGGYGLLKTGDGTLVLGGDNLFGTGTSGIGVEGGTLRIEGDNAFGGTAAVRWGTLEVASDAPSGSPGALGNSTGSVVLGASSTLFDSVPEAAVMVIDGSHTVARNINVEAGAFEKQLGARNAATPADFAGNIALMGSADDATGVVFFAGDPTDTVRFTGSLSGGAPQSRVSINPNTSRGTVVFAGTDKSYGSATAVHNGTLRIDAGTATLGNGSWSVAADATLEVNGTLGGAGSLDLSPNAALAGSGTVGKSVTVAGDVRIQPGAGIGQLSTLDQLWESGGIYEWQIQDALAGTGAGWDFLVVDGILEIVATALSPFVVELISLDLHGRLGAVHNLTTEEFGEHSWTLVRADDGIVGFEADAFEIDVSGFANSDSARFSIDRVGNELVLTYTAVPEPSTWILLTFAGFYACRYLAARRPGNR